MRDFTTEQSKKYFGTNLRKAKANYDKEFKRAKTEFEKKYPYTDIRNFKFQIFISRDGEISSTTKIYFFDEDDYNWEVGSVAFNDFFTRALYWGPTKIWDLKGDEVTPTEVSSENFFKGDGKNFPFDLNHFRIFVNSEQSFSFQTAAPNTKWGNSGNVKDIRTVLTVDLDKDDLYFASLMAAYVISQKNGICIKHLREDPEVPKIVTSILRFYVWYHMNRFLRYPEKMSKYLTNDALDFIKRELPVKKIWKKKYHYGEETVSAWLRTQPNRDNIRNAKNYGSKYGGAIGIMYEEVDQVIPADEANDWKKFFLTDSDGIRKTGQLLLQKAVESYVYCVLAAQANTRWKIVGEGAESLQTQEAFAKLAKETVAEDDETVLISNMRTAVSATNVVLNLAILPRMILIPSDMIILKEKIPGYNNTLTIATKSMKFGKNPGLNFSNVPAEREATPDDDNDLEGTAESRGYHLLTDLPPEDQRNLSHLQAKLKTKSNEPKETRNAKQRDPERLGYVTEGTEGTEVPGNRRNRKDKNNKELIAVFSAMSVIGALSSFGFRLLVS